MFSYRFIFLCLLSFNFACAVFASVSFSKRPSSFAQEFPSVAAFLATGGRHLRAEEGKPARRLFTGEEAGYRFAYEYAGDIDPIQVINVDREVAVSAVACDQMSQGRVGLKWGAGAVNGKSNVVSTVQAGDVVRIGPEWRCGAPAEILLLRVDAVEVESTIDMTVTWLATRAISPFEVVKNLYIDFTWEKVEGRRLREWTHEENLQLAYNYNNVTRQAAETLALGPLVCQSCYGVLQPTLRLKLETNGAIPTKASLRVEGGFTAEIELAASNSLALAPADWTRVFELVGPDLVSLVGASIPLFDLVNEATLSLKVLPYFRMDLRGDVTPADLIGEETFKITAETSSSNTYFELEWTPDGYTTSIDFDLSHNVNLPEVWRVGRILMAGLRFCVGLNITMGSPRQVLTGLEVCPELFALMSQSPDGRRLQGAADNNARLVAAEALLAPYSGEVDSLICIDLRSFTTTTYGDLLDLDGRSEPFAKACFFGRCVQTSYNNRFGGRTNLDNCACNMNWGGCGRVDKWCYTDSNCPSAEASSVIPGRYWAWCNPDKVTWFDGPQCIQIPLQTLDSNRVSIHAMEYDPIFSDDYTVPYDFHLNESCRTEIGCNFTWDLQLRSGYLVFGTNTRATLEATVLVRSLPSRRVQSMEPARSMSCARSSEMGTDVQVQVGVTTAFAGFQYPSFFQRGAMQTVIDPVAGPSVKPQPVINTCYSQEVSGTSPHRRIVHTTSVWPIFVIFLCNFS